MYQNNTLNVDPQFNPLNGNVYPNPNYMFNQPSDPQFNQLNQPVNAPNNQFSQPIQQSTNAAVANVNNQSNQEETVIHTFFNMNNMGDTAVVRLLHTSVNTIERAFVHSVTVDGKKKSVKCVGDNCAICATGAYKNNRAYIRLIDYTDGQIKVWVRTDAILSQFSEIEQNWGNLSQCVLKITRLTQDFPKYSVEIMPPHSYPAFDATDVDKKIAYRFYLSKNADEIGTYVNTGVFPPRQPKVDNNQAAPQQGSMSAVPKSQYYGQQTAPVFTQPELPNFEDMSDDPFPVPNAAPQQGSNNANSGNPYVGPTGIRSNVQEDLFAAGSQFNQNGGFTPIRKVN